MPDCKMYVWKVSHWLCARCWFLYTKDGTKPPWLTAMIALSAAEEKQERQKEKYEISLEKMMEEYKEII